jgi:hypothetical protein
LTSKLVSTDCGSRQTAAAVVRSRAETMGFTVFLGPVRLPENAAIRQPPANAASRMGAMWPVALVLPAPMMKVTAKTARIAAHFTKKPVLFPSASGDRQNPRVQPANNAPQSARATASVSFGPVENASRSIHPIIPSRDRATASMGQRDGRRSSLKWKRQPSPAASRNIPVRKTR